MEKRFEYRGDLAVTPMAEILATIHRYRVAGVLTVSRDGRHRQIHIEDDVVVFATSNEREMSLGMSLLKRGVLTPELAREAEARRAHQGLRLGQILLQMGVVTPESLNHAIAEQIRGILWTSFDWGSGEVVFGVGDRRTGELVGIDLPLPEVIYEGIRRATEIRRFAQRLGDAHTLFEGAENPSLSLFSPAERRYHEKVDGKTPLQDLCQSGPGSVSENARTLYTFFCLGLLRRASTSGARKLHWKTEGGSL